MLTLIYLGLHRRLQDGVIITNPSVVTDKVQPLSEITRPTYNKKGVLVERAKYPILRQSYYERCRSNYHMASLEGLKNSDLYLIEAKDMDNWVDDVEETSSSQLNTRMSFIVDGVEVTGTLLEFHNQSSVEGMLTNLLKGKFRHVLRTQIANDTTEFDEMMQELYCGQTSESVWGWLNIARTLDTETQSNAQQMVYIRTEFERKLLNRLDRKLFKNYFAETSVSDAESAMRSKAGMSEDDSFSLMDQVFAENNTINDSLDFDTKLTRIKKLMSREEQIALENYLNYVPDDKLFGETSEGAPICVKRCDVEAWDAPKDFIQLQVGDEVEFHMKNGKTVIVTIARMQLDDTRKLFKIESSDSSGEHAKLRVFGIDKNYLQSLAEKISQDEDTLKPDFVPTRSYAHADKPPLTKFEHKILEIADSDPLAFLRRVTELANDKYESKVTTSYNQAEGTYTLEHSPTRRVQFTKPETLLRVAVGK